VLEHLIRSPTSEHRIVERARIIVTADDGAGAALKQDRSPL
jgi:hypothetical protein